MAPKLKLTYFNIEGAAEKVRLALKLGGLEFQDERIEMAAWQQLKPSTPYGQLPLLSIDDQPPVTQSFAMLRYIGRLSNLYPEDPVKALHVDEVCGLQEDFARALSPSMYIGMRPHLFGYPENMPEDERKAVQAKLRAALMAEGGDIPRFLGYFDALLAKNGTGYFCGPTATIADCTLLPVLRQLKSGRLDGIPTNVVDSYPNLAAFYDRMMELPAIKAHYAK